MNAKLYRESAETRGTDISWSVVGPGHDRCYFGLIAIAGYAAKGRKEEYPYSAPPFSVYSMGSHEVSKKLYKTIGAAKRVVRAWVTDWILQASDEVEWRDEHTGVHFTGFVNGIQVANYYFCPTARGHWHQGFRVWFGGTYYVTEFASIEEAREAVAASYKLWLTHARKCLLKSYSSTLNS